MGLVEVKRALVMALQTGNYDHEKRDVMAEKNLLAVGEVTARDVIRFVQRTTGREYSTSLHHWDASITVHTLRPVVGRKRWYVKAYFVEGETTATFISVHG